MTMTTSPNDVSKSSTDPDAAITAILADPGTTSLTPPAWREPSPAPEAATTTVAPPAEPARPTVRWGALVWALLFGTTAATTLWVLVDPARRDVVGDWLITLNPLTATLAAVIIVGVVVALFGIVGLIRRAERTRR
jgi:hypothetical protein